MANLMPVGRARQGKRAPGGISMGCQPPHPQQARTYIRERIAKKSERDGTPAPRRPTNSIPASVVLVAIRHLYPQRLTVSSKRTIQMTACPLDSLDISYQRNVKLSQFIGPTSHLPRPWLQLPSFDTQAPTDTCKAGASCSARLLPGRLPLSHVQYHHPRVP